MSRNEHPDKVPYLIMVHEIARQYNKLPYEIKQMPWSEFQEMIEMRRLRNEWLGDN